MPVAALEVKVTLPPVQNVVGPLAVTVGPLTGGATVTTIGADAEDVQPATVCVAV